MHLADHGFAKFRSFVGIDVIGKFHINGGSNIFRSLFSSSDAVRFSEYNR